MDKSFHLCNLRPSVPIHKECGKYSSIFKRYFYQCQCDWLSVFVSPGIVLKGLY